MTIEFHRRLVPIAASLLLCACSNLMPVYERPALPVPDEFTRAVPALAQAAPVSLDWASYFPDPQLRGLIETALRNNRDLRVAVLNIEQARAQFQIREAERLPGVGASATANRARNAAGDPATVYAAGLLVSSWEIDFFGRLASLSEVARAQFLATQEARKAAHTALVSSVATSWLNLLADEELLRLAQQTFATREESLRLVKLRFDNGASSELDLHQAESLAESARVVVAQARRQSQLDRNALELLLGQALPADFRAAAALGSVNLADIPAGVPSTVLVQRPDVRQAELQLEGANANIGAARAAFFPRITLTAGIGSASEELTGLFKGGTWAFTAAPTLLQPLFDAGRNQANLEVSRVSRDIAVSQYERAIQSAFREVNDALSGRALLADQLEAQRRVAQAEGTRLRLSQLRYEAGVSSSLELLDAQRSAFVAEQALIQTRLQQLQNQIALYRAVGGGWSNRE